MRPLTISAVGMLPTLGLAESISTEIRVEQVQVRSK